MSRQRFGATWWGKAWIDALEQRARLDPNRLPRGRTYARQGHVLDVDVQPGLVVAHVQGRRRTPYIVRLRVRTFSAAEWERLFAVVAEQAGYAAALLDGELDPGVAAAAREAAADLLPGAGELGPRCSCPDWADPCKHAAAVCYLVADLLDDDPFALFLLRGRGRDEVMAGVRAARRAGGQPPAEALDAGLHRPADAGVPAAVAWSTDPGPLPPVPSLPARPGRPRLLADLPATTAHTSPAALAALASDAAARAHAVLADDAPSGLELDAPTDLARRAAGVLGTPDLASLARRSGRTERELAAFAIAWRVAGPVGVGLVDGRVTPVADEERLAAGLAALVDAGVDARRRADRLVVGRDHVVLGPERRWYLLQRRGRRLELHVPPADDPLDLLGTDDGTARGYS